MIYEINITHNYTLGCISSRITSMIASCLPSFDLILKARGLLSHPKYVKYLDYSQQYLQIKCALSRPQTVAETLDG